MSLLDIPVVLYSFSTDETRASGDIYIYYIYIFILFRKKIKTFCSGGTRVLLHFGPKKIGALKVFLTKNWIYFFFLSFLSWINSIIL